MLWLPSDGCSRLRCRLQVVLQKASAVSEHGQVVAMHLLHALHHLRLLPAACRYRLMQRTSCPTCGIKTQASSYCHPCRCLCEANQPCVKQRFSKAFLQQPCKCHSVVRAQSLSATSGQLATSELASPHVQPWCWSLQGPVCTSNIDFFDCAWYTRPLFAAWRSVLSMACIVGFVGFHAASVLKLCL